MISEVKETRFLGLLLAVQSYKKNTQTKHMSSFYVSGSLPTKLTKFQDCIHSEMIQCM